MKKVLKYHAISLITAIIIILFIGLFRDFTIKKYLIFLGNGFLFSGTLGYLAQGYVQSWGNESLPEKINRGLLISFYLIGFTLILIFS